MSLWKNWLLVLHIELWMTELYNIKPMIVLSRGLVSVVLKIRVRELSDPSPIVQESSPSQIYAFCPWFLWILVKLAAKYHCDTAFGLLTIKLTEAVTVRKTV